MPPFLPLLPYLPTANKQEQLIESNHYHLPAKPLSRYHCTNSMPPFLQFNSFVALQPLILRLTLAVTTTNGITNFFLPFNGLETPTRLRSDDENVLIDVTSLNRSLITQVL